MSECACAVCAAQVRGSIPLYWGQDAASMTPMNPKPAIQLQQNDPHFTATRLHFQVQPLACCLCDSGAPPRARTSRCPRRSVPSCLECCATLPAIVPSLLLARSFVLARNTGCGKSRWDVGSSLVVSAGGHGTE